MVTQAIMGSDSLLRQGSLYDLTLDEVQNQLGNLGKPLGSMNLDELLRTLCTAEAIDNGGSAPAQFAPGSSLNRELSKKTVEEVWREIQQEMRNRNQERHQNRLGEMTLEEFLAQAGVCVDSNVAHNSQWIQYQMQQRNNVLMPNQHVRNKTVERRQKRMIKNRESAARSRARRQAYTQELENKVSRLEDENRRLKRIKVEKVLPSAPPPEPKNQLRRTSSSSL